MVERGPGVETEYIYGLMGTRGGGTGRLVFRNCRVPKENLIGELKTARIWPDTFIKAVATLGDEPRLRELALVYAAYQERLQAQGWADRAGLGWLAVEALEERAPNVAQDWPLLVVDGFDNFTPVQLALLDCNKAEKLGVQPLGPIRAYASAGVAPRVMGLGPIPATRNVLAKSGLSLDEIDLIEANEAFAAQALACLQYLDIPDEKLNVCGGSIAIGHPLGATGARIVTTLIHALVDRDATLGLATMCVGLGQGIALIVERLN